MFVESGNFVIPPAFDVPVRGGGLVWYGKTRKVWLPDGDEV